MRSQLMSNYLELDEQWRQRSEQMFRRCLKELDATKAQCVWDAACQSEQRRLEWKSTYLKQEEKIRIFVAADRKRTPFTSYIYQDEGRFPDYITSSRESSAIKS